MREFIVPLPQCPKKHSVIPAKAGIHNSRACGNSSSYYPNTPATPVPEKTLRHSREGGNLQFPRMREFHRPTTPMPEKTLRHSREGGNPPHHPSFREGSVFSGIGVVGRWNSRMRSSYYPNTPATPVPEKTLRHSREGGNLQFPRMREFHRPTTPMPEKTLRHSREGGNPQFPH